MIEREDPYEKCKEAVIKGLENIGRSQKNPSLIDRVTIPIDKKITIILARMLEITDKQIEEHIKKGFESHS